MVVLLATVLVASVFATCAVEAPLLTFLIAFEAASSNSSSATSSAISASFSAFSSALTLASAASRASLAASSSSARLFDRLFFELEVPPLLEALSELLLLPDVEFEVALLVEDDVCSES